MEILYSKDEGQIYLDHINYTGNGSLTPRNTVTFVRDDGARPDAPVMYTAGFGVTTRYRLERIDITADSKPVRSYKISYAQSAVTSQSLVSSVQQYGKDGNSTLPAVSMEYSPESVGFDSTVNWSVLNTAFAKRAVADFSGDGRTDLLNIEFGIQYNDDHGIWPNYFAILNVATPYSLGSTWGAMGTWDEPNSFKFCDVDGDGKTDVFYLL